MAVVAALAVIAACERADEAPVTWTAGLAAAETATPGETVVVRVDARMDRGWYVYSVTQPAGGPIPTRIWLADTGVFRQSGEVEGPRPTRAYDNAFDMDVEKYLTNPSFAVPVEISPRAQAGSSDVRVSALFQACNDTVCLSPKTVTMSVPIRIESP